MRACLCACARAARGGGRVCQHTHMHPHASRTGRTYGPVFLRPMQKRKKRKQVVEFGCGPARLAARLLDQILPPTCAYLGVDQSAGMLARAAARLERFAPRARVQQLTGGDPCRFGRGLAAGSVDVVVSTYVLDILSDADIASMLRESHRLLRPGGVLCLTGLTFPQVFFLFLVVRFLVRAGPMLCTVFNTSPSPI